MTSKKPDKKSPLDNLAKPGKNEKPIGDEDLKKVTSSDAFYTTPRTPDHRNFFYFHDYGDYLKGFLLSKRSNVHINRSSSYLIRVTDMRRDGKDEAVQEGQVEEFFGNRHVQKAIDKNELIGSLVRIVYVGRQKTGWGHAAKIYRVFKDVGVFEEMEVSKNEPRPRKRRRKTRTGTK